MQLAGPDSVQKQAVRPIQVRGLEQLLSGCSAASSSPVRESLAEAVAFLHGAAQQASGNKDWLSSQAPHVLMLLGAGGGVALTLLLVLFVCVCRRAQKSQRSGSSLIDNTPLLNKPLPRKDS